MDKDFSDYLKPGPCIDSDDRSIVELAQQLTQPAADHRQNAIALYYWVRDEIRYNPYGLGLTLDDQKASRTLAAGQGWCVTKAILLAALCRASGIPARLGFADVRNHLSTQRLRDTMDTDIFYFHGYSSLFLEGKWVKATPAFNLSLCEKFRLKPLEFDGLEDSIYHPFDELGNRHMEYVNERGEYPELPFDEMMTVFRDKYPYMFEHLEPGDGLDSEQWDRDVDRETAHG
jgi:transglutaminase-like putative cysteine protease